MTDNVVVALHAREDCDTHSYSFASQETASQSVPRKGPSCFIPFDCLEPKSKEYRIQHVKPVRGQGYESLNYQLLSEARCILQTFEADALFHRHRSTCRASAAFDTSYDQRHYAQHVNWLIIYEKSKWLMAAEMILQNIWGFSIAFWCLQWLILSRGKGMLLRIYRYDYLIWAGLEGYNTSPWLAACWAPKASVTEKPLLRNLHHHRPGLPTSRQKQGITHFVVVIPGHQQGSMGGGAHPCNAQHPQTGDVAMSQLCYDDIYWVWHHYSVSHAQCSSLPGDLYGK